MPLRRFTLSKGGQRLLENKLANATSGLGSNWQVKPENIGGLVINSKSIQILEEAARVPLENHSLTNYSQLLFPTKAIRLLSSALMTLKVAGLYWNGT